MFKQFVLVLLFMLTVSLLNACGGTQNRPDDAQPLPEDVPVASANPSPEATSPPAEPIERPTAVPAEAADSSSSETAGTESQPATGDGSVVGFKITGGIVGFCDELDINQNGEYTLVSCSQSEPIQGTLDEPDLVSLQAWVENLTSFQMLLEDNPDGADNMVRDLTFSGQGQTEADELQQQVIFDWVNGLIARTRTPQADIPPTPTLAPVVDVKTEGLCPDINRPALLTMDFNNPNILIVVDPDTLVTCNIGLDHPPFGRVSTAGGNIYFPVFDPDAQTAKVWRLSADGEQIPLEFTTITMTQPAPYDFILSEDDSRIVWAWNEVNAETDPPLFRNNLRIANVDGSNQIVVMDQAENSEGRFVVPVRFSADGSTFFYTLQPDIGGPIFSGRFDTLYSIPSGGGDTRFMYGCPEEENPVCIGGINSDGSVITVVQPQEGTIQVLNSEGGIISTVSLPATDYIERTAFSPSGNMAFLSATLVQAADGEPPKPSPGYISFVAPPYTEQPQNLLSDSSVGTMRGWLDDNRLIFGALDEADNTNIALVNTNGQVTQISPNIAVGVLR